MNSIFEKEDYTIEDLQSLIDNEIEESIHLDFKAGLSLGKSDSKKNELTKDVAAFANSDGGILIYGMNEQNHKANSFSFLDGNEFTKEWLEQIINSSIQRRIEGIKIIPVRKDKNILETIYVVKIPQSIDTPHLSRDKRFYKRFNFESIQMEEYEIRQLYNRKAKSKLFIKSTGILRRKSTSDGTVELIFEVQVTNPGDVSENIYKTNIIFENFNELINIHWDKSENQYQYTFLDDHKVKISAFANMPIFPNESICSVRFIIEYPKSSQFLALKDLKYTTYLFYSNGDDSMEGNFAEWLDKLEEVN